MERTCLVLDTTNGWMIVGLFRETIDGKKMSLQKEICLRTKREASTRLAPTIQNLLQILQENGLEKPDWIICAIGPGSFTGCRIGVGTARNLAQLWDIPVLGLDSLAYYCYHYVELLKKKRILAYPRISATLNQSNNPKKSKKKSKKSPSGSMENNAGFMLVA